MTLVYLSAAEDPDGWMDDGGAMSRLWRDVGKPCVKGEQDGPGPAAEAYHVYKKYTMCENISHVLQNVSLKKYVKKVVDRTFEENVKQVLENISQVFEQN